MVPSFTTEPSPRVTCGANRVDRLGEDVERLAGRSARVLLVTDPGLIAAGAAGRVQRILDEAGHATAVFSDLTGEPQVDQVEAAAGLARKERAQAVVGLGGGSLRPRHRQAGRGGGGGGRTGAALRALR